MGRLGIRYCRDISHDGAPFVLYQIGRDAAGGWQAHASGLEEPGDWAAYAADVSRRARYEHQKG